MMKPRGWRLLGAIMGVAALALAGCGENGGNGSSGNSQRQGPLAEFFGWDEEWRGGDYEATEEDRQRHYEVQDYVVTCMSEAGFEYFPEPFWGDDERSRGGNDPWEEMWQLRQEDPEAFAREYGYGITTVDYGDGEGEDDWDPSEDPNWEYRESLSEAAQEEYERALWGEWPEEFEEGAVDDEMVIDAHEAGGCMNEAYEEVYDWGDEEGDQFEDLWERWDTLYDGINNDSRLVDAMQAWSACMADAGYSGLSEQWDAEERVYDRQAELYGWDEPSEAEASLSPVDDEEEPYEPYEPDAAELAELRDFELAIAWADFECKQEHNVEEVRQEVTFEHEERFIEENRADLEAYRDWQNERGY